MLVAFAGLLCLWLLQVNAATDSILGAFLNDANKQLATAYDRGLLAELQNELQGPNDVVALLEIEIAQENLLGYVKSILPKVGTFKGLEVGDAQQKRQLHCFPQLGYEALPQDKLKRIYALTANMSDSYRNVRLCAYQQPQNCTLRLIPDVQQLLQQSHNLEEIEYYWFEWRRCTGQAMRAPFVQFMTLYKEASLLNGYPRAEDYWFRSLDLSGRQAMSLLDGFMAALHPLFLQFHAHVRGSLRKMYGEMLVPKGTPYPQHLAEVFLGNAYGRSRGEWFVDLPDATIGLPNITDGMRRRGLTTTRRVFWNVAEYFRSMGFPQLENELWTQAKPIATQDADRCWHKAWRFYAQPQYNFTYCKINDEERFFNMFEAQSDMYYYLAAAGQPTLLRDEPFPNFSDALGKFFSLAASSPRYLNKLGLLPGGLGRWHSLPARLNRLYLQGLRVIFLLPIFYELDRYRVDVLRGRIRADDNDAYWQLTKDYTGASPPSKRSNEHFDVPAKLLLEVDDQYSSHIMSIVLQFQLYKHYCNWTGQFVPGASDKPLDLCDLSDQRDLGPKIFRAMALGSSVHYTEVLYALLGTRELSLDGLLTYFQPLHDWLLLQNKQNGLEVGWQ